MMRTVIADYVTFGRHFVIGRTEQNGDIWYVAIEDKDIDENGRLKRALNGLQMHAEPTLSRCIKSLEFDAEWNHMESLGYSKEEIAELMM